jgi:Zn-finger nucleic acid-binding protein
MLRDLLVQGSIPLASDTIKLEMKSIMMAVCPKCDIALVLLEFHGVQIDFCPRCDGLWLDSGEIKLLIERTGGKHGDPLRDFVMSRSRSEIGRPAYLCPRCDRALKEVVRRGENGEELRLDRCPRGDGVWFDKNELHLLLQTLPREIEAQGAIAILSDVLGGYAEVPTGEEE